MERWIEGIREIDQKPKSLDQAWDTKDTWRKRTKESIGFWESTREGEKFEVWNVHAWLLAEVSSPDTALTTNASNAVCGVFLSLHLFAMPLKSLQSLGTTFHERMKVLPSSMFWCLFGCLAAGVVGVSLVSDVWSWEKCLPCLASKAAWARCTSTATSRTFAELWSCTSYVSYVFNFNFNFSPKQSTLLVQTSCLFSCRLWHRSQSHACKEDWPRPLST